jgi:hypothetical protein
MSEEHVDFEPPMDLPKPRPETDNEVGSFDNQTTTEKVGAQAVERGISAPPVMPSPIGQLPLQAATPQSPGSGVQDGDGTVPTPPIADDVDLIEKEWVYKAKEIVARTKDDPYNQNKQMNQVKADYLKKRYNKELETPEE